MNLKLFQFCCILLMLTSLFTVSAEEAKIRGAIYDHNLDPISKTVLTINSTPVQTRVSQFGGYHFIVPPGSYEIVATLTRNGITREIARDTITISSEGEFVKDLFIFPDFDMRTEFEETRFMRITAWLNEYYGMVIIGLSVLVFLFTGYYKVYARKKRKQMRTLDIEQRKEDESHTESQIEKDIVALLQKEPKGLSQKNIRKKFSCSEAKISLILKKLEEEDVIIRKKSGRSNTIHLVDIS
ncbi:MAG: helix-turn-helix transcriptional regulator [Candidatus Woesearchaeota archaeon]